MVCLVQVAGMLGIFMCAVVAYSAYKAATNCGPHEKNDPWQRGGLSKVGQVGGDGQVGQNFLSFWYLMSMRILLCLNNQKTN